MPFGTICYPHAMRALPEDAAGQERLKQVIADLAVRPVKKGN